LHGPAKREARVGVGLTPSGWQGAHSIVVKLERRADLPEAVGAGGAASCFASRHQRREEQCGEEADDGDGDEQLEDGEGSSRCAFRVRAARGREIPLIVGVAVHALHQASVLMRLFY
jgi:hypothetical protein